jgi:hypothetical protein
MRLRRSGMRPKPLPGGASPDLWYCGQCAIEFYLCEHGWRVIELLEDGSARLGEVVQRG